MKKSVISMCLALLGSLISMNVYSAIDFRIAHDSQENSPLHESLLFFKQQLEQKSDGEFNVQIYPSGQLGGVRETTEMVQHNNIQMTTAASVLLSPYIPEFNVLDLFYLFKDEEHAHAVLDGEVGQKLLKAMEKKHFYGLGYGEVGFRNFSNNIHPLKTLDDFNTLKIRSADNPTQIIAWKSIGLLPIPLAWGEIYTSLQQGLINGQESALISILTQRFYESQKYLSLTKHIYTNHVFFTSLEFWESLNPEQKNLLSSEIKNTIKLQRRLSKEKNQETLNVLQNKGMEINDVPEDTKEILKEKLNSSISKQVKEKAGKELYDYVLKKINSEQ
ncbi:TRAP transporter substrate-binding protein [Spirabiliibacterium falconis]|uniref:TRAP transporter substrate-binding protein n=1 Tax=Spirabiliibacterium falconis TaxID=572023 RepID=UPI001AAE05D9|nr:TRAP transporter substrate-binding protein [Spirabiliibacterium falconis]MBE2894894.1 TRAP transporter substrate-binding protein [Spirabiliibacterium falconis]